MTAKPIQVLGGIIFFLLSYFSVVAQERVLHVQASEGPILIDGLLQEADWQKAAVASDFHKHFPADSGPAELVTEVRLLFDERYLYIAAYCRQSPAKDFVVQSLKRDFEFNENDAFDVYLDAFGDATSGFAFGVNPYGVQRDGIIPYGGTKDIDLTWDNRWFVEVNRQADAWTLEMAIPFKSLRFKKNQKEWRINFARNAFQENERSTWAPVNRGNAINTLSLMGTLLWESPPPSISRNIALVPYLAFKAEKEPGPDVPTLKPLTGLDAKIGIGSALHFDLTINPDFSQVEVDQQVIDLNRFELFFPEKRLLFLENSDLFSTLGNSRVRPFFSRRIGSLNQEPVPILFGGRLSGKLDKTWKLGLMDVQTRQSSPEQNDGQNYLVATVQKSLFSSSSLTAFFSNRQLVQDFHLVAQNYTRIGGLEFDYRSKDSKFSGKSFLHYASAPQFSNHSMAYSTKVRYRTKAFSFFVGIDGIEENYLPDMGFVPRLYHYDELQDTSYRVPYIESRANSYYRYFPEGNTPIDFIGTELRLRWFTNPRFQYQEHLFNWNLIVNLLNQSRFTFTFSDYTQLLLYPFTLQGLDRPFASGTYANRRFTFQYDTGKRQALYGKIKAAYGGEFVGNRLNLSGEINYRYFQFLVFGLNYSYQQLENFPQDFGSAKFTLLGSKLEWSFNRKLFLTTFIQYNTQDQNFNINGRFNWRFQPLSDLYIVYTSNYLTDHFTQKDRALVLKLNYWLNW